MSEEASVSRRHFLTVATTVTGVVGLALTAAPFIASFRPSTRARALGAPVTVDISKLDEGAMVRVSLARPARLGPPPRARTCWSAWPARLSPLKDADSAKSIQPEYATGMPRARLRPEYLVVIGNCTHLGCAPLERFEVAPADLARTGSAAFSAPATVPSSTWRPRVKDEAAGAHQPDRPALPLRGRRADHRWRGYTGANA